LDWEYPLKEDFENYVKLLDKFDETMVNTNYILGVSVSPINSQIDAGYDVHRFVSYVDFVNVLSYDYNGPWINKTDHSSPLHSKTNSQASSLEYWHSKGVPKDKLILSLPFFGRTWKLFNTQNPGRGALTEGAGAPGPYTNQAGYLAYNELCYMMTQDPQLWTLRYDTNAVATYAVQTRHWISYESTRTLTEKARFVVNEGYAGVSVFWISADDFRGDCGTTKFPLLHAIHTGFQPEEVINPEIPKEEEGFKCASNGYFRDILDCRKWYSCITNENGELQQNANFCEKGFAFDHTLGVCNHKEFVKGCEND